MASWEEMNSANMRYDDFSHLLDSPLVKTLASKYQTKHCGYAR